MECRNETGVNYEANENEPIFEARICLKGNRSVGRQIANRKELESYVTELMSDYATETLLVVAVDAQCRVLSTAIVGVGGLSSVDVDVASIAKVALLSNAKAVFLSHNHPGGSCWPSPEDIQSTMLIKKALELFQIGVYDHMIVCPNGDSYSMRQHGDIN